LRGGDIDAPPACPDQITSLREAKEIMRADIDVRPLCSLVEERRLPRGLGRDERGERLEGFLPSGARRFDESA
jgi:hypothetical protein